MHGTVHGVASSAVQLLSIRLLWHTLHMLQRAQQSKPQLSHPSLYQSLCCCQAQTAGISQHQVATSALTGFCPQDAVLQLVWPLLKTQTPIGGHTIADHHHLNASSLLVIDFKASHHAVQRAQHSRDASSKLNPTQRHTHKSRWSLATASHCIPALSCCICSTIGQNTTAPSYARATDQTPLVLWQHHSS
jgi:hypothetical protein